MWLAAQAKRTCRGRKPQLRWTESAWKRGSCTAPPWRAWPRAVSAGADCTFGTPGLGNTPFQAASGWRFGNLARPSPVAWAPASLRGSQALVGGMSRRGVPQRAASMSTPSSTLARLGPARRGGHATHKTRQRAAATVRFLRAGCCKRREDLPGVDAASCRPEFLV